MALLIIEALYFKVDGVGDLIRAEFVGKSMFGLVSADYRERVWREKGGQTRLATAIGVAPYRGRTQML
nr:unnamed protein product [Callosobruchus chinensis]